jgi:hypothetical protein
MVDVPVLWLVADAAAGAIALAAALRLFRGQLNDRLLGLLARLSDRLPQRFAGPVGRWFGAQA